MDEREEHLGGSIWRKISQDGERYELRAPRFNHIRELPVGISLAEALQQATEFEGSLFRLEMSEAQRADLANSQSHSSMGEAWQNSPGKEFVEAIDLKVDELSTEQKSLLTSHLDWLMPQENWAMAGQNNALRNIEKSLKTVEKLRGNLADLPPRPPRRYLQEGAEYPHQLAAQLERALVSMQRDYCHELGQIEVLYRPLEFEKHRLLRNVTMAYLRWSNDEVPLAKLGTTFPNDISNRLSLEVRDGKLASPFGTFLETFVDCASVHFEAYRFTPRSKSFQNTITELRKTLQATRDLERG